MQERDHAPDADCDLARQLHRVIDESFPAGADEESLDPADYEMTGVLGRLSIPIRPGGTGELIYSQEGTRRVTGARSEDGEAIPRGSEVMVTRYEKGIAYVRPWEDPAGELEPKG